MHTPEIRSRSPEPQLLVAYLAGAVGEPEADRAITRAGRELNLPAAFVTFDQAFGMFELLGREPDPLGVAARLAKTRLALKRSGGTSGVWPAVKNVRF